MIIVIETNLSLDHEDNIKDHQSRVIKVESWDDFINEVKEARCVIRSAYFGSMYGTTIPRSAKIENLTYDDFHLTCDVYNYAGQKTKSYVIEFKSNLDFKARRNSMPFKRVDIKQEIKEKCESDSEFAEEYEKLQRIKAYKKYLEWVNKHPILFIESLYGRKLTLWQKIEVIFTVFKEKLNLR